MGTRKSACRFDWCETPADLHHDDPSDHSRDLGFGMKLCIDNEGNPITNWMPDWSEWWIDTHGDISTEYEGVAKMLSELEANYTAFRNDLINDPRFAREVEAMQAEIKSIRESIK
jgi:hypothetical protein